MYIPNCDSCVHYQECVIKKELKELRETIFNINREISGRNNFIKNGKIIKEQTDIKK